MCGFFGHFEVSGSTKGGPYFDRLQYCLNTLGHRGPNDNGLEVFTVNQGTGAPTASLALGHTRLSIIDLSPGGHQPMHSGDKRFTIVFNGEIYNYREIRQELKGLGYTFQTDSDTEVLLAAWASWGVAGLRRLKGMFAFAVYDRADQSLTLVRDAFGIKPLFYQQKADSFRFASEMPALLCLAEKKPAVNFQQAYDYLVFGSYDNSRETFYRGVNHLLPGHSLRIDLRPMQIGAAERWWWPSIQERTDLSFEGAADQLREMFLNNVRLHLRSDVPVGAALSGGIDSSSVVCAMRYLEPDMPINTFSFVARGSSLDEEKWIDIVNKHVAAIPHKVVVQPDELASDLADMIRSQGEPFGSTSIYAQYRVYKAAREAGITVTLDGQGADEALAGYHGYPDRYIQSLLDHGRYLEALRFVRNWSKWPNRGPNYAFLMLGSAIIPPAFRSFARRVIGENPVPKWIDRTQLKALNIKTACTEHLSTDREAKARRLVEHLRFVLTAGSLASLLRHGDRNSMRWSVESRVPFLTIEMVEFLLSLPESFLLSPHGETKHIFRHAMRGIVPDIILTRRDKVGFETPERAWLSSPALMNIDLASSGGAALPFLRHSEVKKTFKYTEDRVKAPTWRLLNLYGWISGCDARDEPQIAGSV